MKKLIPLTAVAGVLACFVAAGSVQAAPASGNVLGKLTNVAPSAAAVEQVGWRRHHRRHFWWRHHHRRHWRHHWR